MKVKILEPLAIGTGDTVFSKHFYDSTPGCEIVPHDSRDDSDRNDPLIGSILNALSLLPGRLIFIRTPYISCKALIAGVLKVLWNIRTVFYQDESGWQFVCDTDGIPLTVAQSQTVVEFCRVFIYLPRQLKDRQIPSYTDEALKEKLKEALDAPLF